MLCLSSFHPPLPPPALRLCRRANRAARIAMLETLVPLALPVSSFQSACTARPVCRRYASALSARGLSRAPDLLKPLKKDQKRTQRNNRRDCTKPTRLSKLLVLFCSVGVRVRLSQTLLLFYSLTCLLSTRSVTTLTLSLSVLPICCSLLNHLVLLFLFGCRLSTSLKCR